MGVSSRTGRAAAAAIAFVCWVGLAVQFSAIIDQGASAPAALWIMLRYLTILTNVTVAVLFTAVALGKSAFASPSLLGGMTMAIVLVGVAYFFLLRGLLELTGGAKLADLILHYVTPIGVLIFWLLLVPKGGLTRRDPLRWAVYPLAYLVYALFRGATEDRYAYPFLDIARHGLPQVAVISLLILIAFLGGGFALV